jgi:hypothetical protein
MLSKDVCKKCYLVWGEYDEELWRKGKVECWVAIEVRKKEDVLTSIKDRPPEWCPRVFEHAIAAGMGKT